jgi:hypothetical protein
MLKLKEDGSLLIPLVLIIVMLLSSLGFGLWAFTGRQDYKNNVDIKIADAVEVASNKVRLEKESEFAEKEKSPFKSYQGPATYGSLVINHPKTWSAYISEKSSGNIVITGYMHPNYVPEITSDISFALRFEVVNTSHDNVLKTYESLVKSGKLVSAAYRAPQVSSVLGSRLEGEVSPKKQGVLVLLPLRDKTIKIWTEGQEFRTDFSTMLDSFSFVP